MNYDVALDTLRNIAKGSEWYPDFLNYESQLRDNLANDARYGSSEQSRRDRARIINELNRVILEYVGLSFNELALGQIPQPSATHNQIDKISILFLSSEPSDAVRLRLGQELREIESQLARAKFRDNLTFFERTAVRPVDLTQAMLDTKPQIVHFSGHGSPNGCLVLEDISGASHEVEPGALSALFEQFAQDLECVVLNACYSETQAQDIVRHIRFVIGMKDEIGDEAAIAFSVGFYQAIGAGRNIESAYALGCVQVRLKGLANFNTPKLMRKQSTTNN
jgi:hypothetical protein